MHNSEILIAAVVEEACLTLEQLSAACSVEPEWIIRHVNDGLLPHLSEDDGCLQFTSNWLRRARRISSIERNFDATPELAALVADLQEELDDVRRRLRRAGLE